MNGYLFPRVGVKLVKGAARAALYDTQEGKVYSINQDAIQVIEDAARGNVNGNAEYLNQLTTVGLFVWIDQPYDITQLYPEKTPDDKVTTRLKFFWAELTNRCNLRCLHCYADAGQEVCVGELTTGEWKKIILDGFDCGARRMQFIGGEPFARRDLKELVQFTSDVGFSEIEIFTNGTLIPQGFLDWAKKISGIGFAVSLYSNDERVHDSITGISGSWRKTNQAIQYIKECGLPLRVALIVMHQNEDTVESTLLFCSENGLSCRRPDIVRSTGRGASALLPTRIDIIQSCTLTKPDFSTSQVEFEKAQRWNTCWANKVAITPNGEIIPCIFARDLVVGNVTQNTLSEILKSERLQNLWSLTKDQVDGCKVCEYRYACRDCRPLAIANSGSLYGSNPRCGYSPETGIWNASSCIPH